jgi:hypothetical protein
MGLFDIFVDERAEKGVPAVLQGRERANERARASFPKDAIIPECCCERSAV